MKRILGIVVLGLLLSVNSYADDDISDLQLNGMSIGDSALKYFDEKKIKKNKKMKWYKNKELIPVLIKISNNDFDSVSFTHKKADNDYIILSITGYKDYFDINQCNKKKLEEANIIEETFPDLNKDTYTNSHPADKSGKSKTYNIEYKFKSGSSIIVACYDWTKKMKYDDHLRMSLLSSEFNKWVKTAHN